MWAGGGVRLPASLLGFGQLRLIQAYQLQHSNRIKIIFKRQEKSHCFILNFWARSYGM
jgi:hypothetical protein